MDWRELDRLAQNRQLDTGYRAMTPGYSEYASRARKDLFPTPAHFLASMQIPVLSDAAGLAADIGTYRDQPSERNWLNYALTGLGLLPFMPGMTSIKPMETLYTGTSGPVEKISPYGDLLEGSGENYFGGLFASGRDTAESHGTGYVQEINVPEDLIATHQDINSLLYGENYADWENKIKDMVYKHKREDISEDEIDEFVGLLAEKKSVYDDLDMGLDRLQEILGYDDIGEMSWDLQGLRGELARMMGFAAVDMEDEHGITRLILNHPEVLLK